ncbi:MAG: FecR family protein [Agriterribacter sp.]
MYDEQRARHLLRLFADNAATEEEIMEMLVLFREDAGDQEREALILELRKKTEDKPEAAIDWEKIWESIQRSAVQPTAPVKKMYWWRVAAAVVILLGIGSYIWFNRSAEAPKEMVKSKPAPTLKDIQPGGDKAVLTLADGSQIMLDSSGNGKLATQGNAEVIKLSGGQLAYKSGEKKTGEILYNTMSTPRGGQYSLILPDGSKVWLNAVSSIRYPTFFEGSERRVEITGEAYFEVAKDASRPFKVSVHSNPGNEGMEVEVLGTHFNINAYNDEPIAHTTLLEGSVKVSRAAVSTIIKPGQQARFDNSGSMKVITDTDIAEVMAWKDGHFIFRDANLKFIMRQIMRWYNVEVKYEGDMPERYFTADISRNKTLADVLKILEQSDIRFRLDGTTLVVTS